MTKEPQEECKHLWDCKEYNPKCHICGKLMRDDSFYDEDDHCNHAWEEGKLYCMYCGKSRETFTPMTPQEETYQTLENKAVEEFEIFLEKWDGHENDLKDFLKSHLQLAYNLGEEKGAQEEKDMTELFEDKKGDREEIRQQAITETEKAFGGCKKCYGKGYSTEHIGKTTAFGDFEGEKDYTVSNPHIEIRYCSCERGKELHKIQNKLITSERNRIRKWAEKYMDKTTKYYGTDKHGIDLDDLLQELQNK